MQNHALISFFLAVSLVSLTLQAAPEEGGPTLSVLQRLRASRTELGLDSLDDFQVRAWIPDELGFHHLRLDQTHAGLRVWGAQAIVHLDPSGAEGPMTDALVRGIRVETRPELGEAEAVAVALQTMGPSAVPTRPPRTELVIWPGEDPGEVSPRLAYQVHVEVERGREDTRHRELLVDARTGALLKSWSTLFTFRRRAARTLGYSQYSGQVALDVLQTPFGFELTDPTRGFATTRDMGGRIQGAGETIYAPGAAWGDGRSYDPGQDTRSANGQTAAVDAHFGMQMSWDFYQNILGRRGIDGRGTGPTSRVHYARGYENAFWVNECMCMTYGDGGPEGPWTSLEVVGHEVSHGLCHATAGLATQGEAGGLNEANSDIFGVLIRHYARAALGAGDRVPEGVCDWTLGGEHRPRPLRFMFKPSLDGASPDEWRPGLGNLEVHLAAGPMNRAFFFLAQGASPDPASPTHTRHLPWGMEGVGNHKALLIWWRTLNTRLPPAGTYQRARDGALLSARELFGPDSPEALAVDNAFKGINVWGSWR